MDLQEKIKKLKELRQRNNDLASKLKKNEGKVKQKNTIIQPINETTSRENINDLHKLTKLKSKSKKRLLKSFFKEQNSELYTELDQDAKRKEYIQNILSINQRHNLHTTPNQTEQDIDNINTISNIKKFADMLLEKRNTRNNELEDNIDTSSNYTSVSSMTNTESNLTSDYEDLTDDDLYLSDSSMDNESELDYIYRNISSNENTTRKSSATRNFNATTNSNAITKTININPNHKISTYQQQDMDNRIRMQEDIEFLKNASEPVKDMCFEYINEAYNKLLKIIKIYLVISKNDFISVSNELSDIDLFGYKYVNYDCKKCITKGTILKIIFVYNGSVELKEFIVHKYNSKTRALEAYYCNITEDEYSGEIIINKAKKITKINPRWIVFTKIEPKELISKFTIST
jgi:hypothetical protein